MLSPIRNESHWKEFLAPFEEWQPPLTPTLIVSPHPDDETLGCGGLIAALRLGGVPVQVAAVTDGEAAYPDYPSLAAVREREQTAALARLGVAQTEIMRLRLPDSAVAAHEPALPDALAAAASSETHILAPWPHDPHPDHEACGRAAAEAARRTGAKLTFYFFWTWHHLTPERLGSLHLVRFPLCPVLLQAKTEALHCHRSQLYREGGEPILPDNLLGPARRLYEVFLPV